MDEDQNDLWLEEESEELSEDIPWEESILDFADWQQDEDTSAYDEGLEEALAEERIAALESELEHDEHPLEAEDDIAEDDDSPEAPISLNTLRQQMDEIAVERLGLAARTQTDFSVVIGEMDRLDRNRERRERYHENLRGDVPLEYKKANYGLVFPEWLNTPEQQLLNKGSFLDLIFDCPYEMHQLTADPFLSKIVEHLKEEHKEVLYFLSLRLYSTIKVAEMRGQSDRNIRKLRDTYTRKLQKKLYEHLKRKRNLTLREQEFMTLYAASAMQDGKGRHGSDEKTKRRPVKRAAWQNQKVDFILVIGL